VGDSASYNTVTKAVSADTLRTSEGPFLLGGDRISTIGERARLVQKGAFTTHDSAKPDFQIRATTVRIYEGDRVVMKNATFYIGRVPVFYWPYVYQSLDDAFSFMVSPAYMSSWGPSLLGRAAFPISQHVRGTVRLDYRVRRGVAIGFQPDINFPKNAGYAKIRSYFVDDQNPTLNRTSLPRSAFPNERYRFAMESRFTLKPDVTGFVLANKMSDPFVHQDFFQTEFTVDPQPDNIVAVNKYDPRYSLTAYTRYQLNRFYDATERLPEVALDIKRQPILGSGIFYEGEASFGNLRRNFARGSYFQDYEALRLDTFHQFLYPKTYLGWLSFVPRVGFRGTYYSETRNVDGLVFPAERERAHPAFPDPAAEPRPAVAARRRPLAHTHQRRRRSLVQNLAHLGAGAEPHPRARRPAPHYPAVRKFLLCHRQRHRSRRDSAVRPLYPIHASPADRLSAVHLDRFDRELDDRPHRHPEPPADAPRRQHHQLDGVRELLRREHR
jgi:LPS-assembly protein